MGALVSTLRSMTRRRLNKTRRGYFGYGDGWPMSQVVSGETGTLIFSNLPRNPSNESMGGVVFQLAERISGWRIHNTHARISGRIGFSRQLRVRVSAQSIFLGALRSNLFCALAVRISILAWAFVRSSLEILAFWSCKNLSEWSAALIFENNTAQIGTETGLIRAWTNGRER